MVPSQWAVLVIKVPSCAALELQKYVLAKLVDYELCELMLERSLVPWAFKALVVHHEILLLLVGGPWCILKHQLTGVISVKSLFGSWMTLGCYRGGVCFSLVQACGWLD